MYRIAIVEDDKSTNDTFHGLLKTRWPDCRVDQFLNFESANEALAKVRYDLVISDIDLGPGTDRYGGAKIAKLLHEKQSPLLVVSGLPQPELHREMFKALDAWDYLQKPVNEHDFINQVSRAITFSQAQERGPLNFDNFQTPATPDPNLKIDLRSTIRVTWKGERVNLSMTQIRILQTLVEQANHAVTFETLFDRIDSGRNKENLRVHIGSIRREFSAIDSEFDSVKNVPMHGYMWCV